MLQKAAGLAADEILSAGIAELRARVNSVRLGADPEPVLDWRFVAVVAWRRCLASWLRKVDATGDRLDPVYEDRRTKWRLQAETGRVGSAQWFG